ncbi:unnamed protein product [Spodoptera exigua]|nr:unnamed protein product [Spodoptera exigua]
MLETYDTDALTDGKLKTEGTTPPGTRRDAVAPDPALPSQPPCNPRNYPFLPAVFQARSRLMHVPRVPRDPRSSSSYTRALATAPLCIMAQHNGALRSPYVLGTLILSTLEYLHLLHA